MAGRTAGRKGHRWRNLREELKAQRQPCWLCGQPIDYAAPPEHPRSFTVDHVKPRATHPELAEDPSNLRASHARCNKSKSDGPVPLGLGDPPQTW